MLIQKAEAKEYVEVEKLLVIWLVDLMENVDIGSH